MRDHLPPVRRDFRNAADPPPKRPPPSQRGHGDLKGRDLARYVEDLHDRMTVHLLKRAPEWHLRETRKLLAASGHLRLTHPRPNWVPPVDQVRVASLSAGHTVGTRLAARDQRMQHIRMNLGFEPTGPLTSGPGPSNGGPKRNGPKQ